MLYSKAKGNHAKSGPYVEKAVPKLAEKSTEVTAILGKVVSNALTY
jgi:hypothetical protein